jgi:hypothetical protein
MLLFSLSRFELDVVELVVKKLNEFITILLDLSYPIHDLLLYIYRCRRIEVGCMGHTFTMSISNG